MFQSIIQELLISFPLLHLNQIYGGSSLEEESLKNRDC